MKYDHLSAYVAVVSKIAERKGIVLHGAVGVGHQRTFEHFEHPHLSRTHRPEPRCFCLDAHADWDGVAGLSLGFLLDVDQLELDLSDESDLRIFRELVKGLLKLQFSYLLLELADNPGESPESFVDLLVLTAALGRTSCADELGHLLEDFTGSRCENRYLL